MSNEDDDLRPLNAAEKEFIGSIEDEEEDWIQDCDGEGNELVPVGEYEQAAPGNLL